MTALSIAPSVFARPVSPIGSRRDRYCEYRTHNPEPLPKLVTLLLPPTERRRANDMAQLAINVAAQAVLELPADEVTRLPCIFSSADGDGRVLGDMLDALAQSNVALSPTLFHNSVFNAPGGYWSIATHCEAAATTLCAGDGSFAGG